MILKNIEKEIYSHINNGCIYPLYDNYCFANIPQAILNLFNLSDKNELSLVFKKANVKPNKKLKIVLLLVDGFGYLQWLKYASKYPFFKRLTQKGVVAPLTAVFPSTTAAALNTIHSGSTPQEHGLPEWWVYFEEIGKIMATLPFMAMGEKTPDQLLQEDVNPKILFNQKTIYQKLAEKKIPSFTFDRRAYTKTAYSHLVYRGSTTIPYINSSDLAVNLRKKLTDTAGSGYFFVYWDNVDAMEHHYGPHSEQYLAELNGLSFMLQKELLDKISFNLKEEILFLITADHGQINVKPQETIFLNQYPQIVNNLKTDQHGQKIMPWGNIRDVFLHIKEDKIQSVINFLAQKLKNKATIIRSTEALQAGLFGRGKTHPEFLKRIGNILVLPSHNNTIWYRHFKDEKIEFYGMHGGLSPEEMLVPLAVTNWSSLH